MKTRLLLVVLAVALLASACAGRPPEPPQPVTAPVAEPAPSPPAPTVPTPPDNTPVRPTSGPPPRLVALNPATGEEQQLAEVPKDAASATLSSDGRWVLLDAASSLGPCASTVWEIETATGKQKALPFPSGFFQDVNVWYEGTWFVTRGHSVDTWNTATGKHERRESAGFIWEGVSPDGRYLSGAAYTIGSAAIGGLSSMTVVVLDLKTGQEKTYPDVAFGVPHAHWVDFRLRWTADSKGLLLGHHKEPKVVETLLLNLETGTVSPVAEKMPRPEDPVFVAHASGWYYERVPGLWGPVTLTAPDGKAYSHGEGLPAGWTPDGRLMLIRWENYQQRRPSQCL